MSYLYAADGSYITSFFDEHREPVTFKQIPKVMQQAIVAAEDTRFFDHRGVDTQGIIRAFVANQKAGEVTQGASTLTQQYVKNVLKYNAKTKEEREAAEAPTAARKLQEARYAIALEQKFTKDEILERYLNIAFFGNGGYGVGAAAQVYFSKRVDQLTLSEAAMIAGLVQNPTQYNPLSGQEGLDAAQVRRDYVLTSMVNAKFISQEEADKANQEPIKLKPKQTPQSCATGRTDYGFYCDYFLTWWKQQPAFGKTAREREENLRKGGYRIYTALDPKMQKSAQQAIDSRISRANKFATGSVLVEPGSGLVKAMAINRTYSLAPNPGGVDAPNTVNPLLTGSETSPGYQAGSTFKMFTMVAALERGLPLNTQIYSPEVYKSIFTGTCKVGGNKYCPKNASKGMTGTHTMWSAFGESVNTYFVQLEEDVTVKAAVSAAERLGVVFRSKENLQSKANVQASPNGDWGSFTLGTALVTPLDMATAYATIAARGKHCEPLPVTKIVDRNGKENPQAVAKKCTQATTPEVADAAADAARCPVGDKERSVCQRNNGVTASNVGTGIDRPVAGKSGTTDDTNSAWFAGFTPNLAGAVFTVNPDTPSQSVEHISHLPIEVFTATMKASLAGMPIRNFAPPTSNKAYGQRVKVPNVAGQDPAAAQKILVQNGFKVKIDAKPIASAQPAGKVAETNPKAGTTASKGSTIMLIISSGKKPPVTTKPAPKPKPGRPR